MKIDEDGLVQIYCPDFTPIMTDKNEVEGCSRITCPIMIGLIAPHNCDSILSIYWTEVITRSIPISHIIDYEKD